MGHREHHDRAAALDVAVAILTVSDTRTAATDASGDAIERLVREAGLAVALRDLVPDDAGRIAGRVQAMAASADLVIVTGGTGIAARDQTVQAVTPLLDKALPGFGELFRRLSFDEIGPAAYLSAAFAGLVPRPGAAGRAAVFCLPGSTGACELALTRLILPEARHLVFELRR